MVERWTATQATSDGAMPRVAPPEAAERRRVAREERPEPLRAVAVSSLEEAGPAAAEGPAMLARPTREGPTRPT